MNNRLKPHESLRESTSNFSALLSITHLTAAATTVLPAGEVELHSASPTLLLLLGSQAIVHPGAIHLQQERVILLPPSTTYRITDAATTSPPAIAAIELNFTIFNLEAHYLLPQAPHLFSEEHSAQFREQIRALSHMEHVPSDIAAVANKLAIGYRLTQVLCNALDLNQRDAMTHQNNEQLRNVLTYMRNNYSQPLTIDDIAEACGMSASLLFKLAPRIGNTTPMQLLKKIRLEESLALLRQEALSIGQIAQAVGFVDANNFSREFRREYGITARQYRQTNVLGVQAGELYKKAETLFKRSEFRRAVILYKRVINAAPNWKNTDQLYYKMGLACHAAGDVTDADEYWTKVSSLHYRLLIRLRRTTDTDDLRDIYRDGDDSIREQLAERAIGLMHRAASAEKFTTARQYSPLCKELAHHHPSTHARLAEALLNVGDNMAVLDCCPDQDFSCARALRSVGLYQEHFERYPRLREQCAHLHMRMKNTEAVLSNYADLPEMCVHALVQAGRLQEAVERFPRHCAIALLALGRHQEIFDRFPDDQEHTMWALALSGKAQQALTKSKPNPDLRANLLLFLESTEELTTSDLQSSYYRKSAYLLRAIHLIEQGEYTAALETLHGIKHIDDLEFKPGDYQTDLLIPFVLSLLPAESHDSAPSSWPEWNTHYRSIIDSHRYYSSQQLWHDAAYVCGEIDEDRYHAQPHRVWSELSIFLVKAIKAECDGDLTRALNLYQDYFRMTDVSRSIYWYYAITLSTNRAFARWRVSALQAAAASEKR